MNLREFVKLLEEKGLLLRVKRPVDIKYEIPTLIRMINDKPIIFENVKNFPNPVVANICSTRDLVSLGLGINPNEIIAKLASAIENPREPKLGKTDGFQEIPAELFKLPILIHYPFDGGPYISSAVVVARDPELGLNVSFHRAMVIGKDKVVMRILPRDFNAFLKRGNREFAICISNSIQVLLASAVSVGLGTSELSIANALSKTDLIELAGHKVPDAEIVLIAEMTGEEHEEGPFLDLTETPDVVRKQLVAKIKRIFVKENAIYHALLPGGLEHKTLMGTPREPTIFREVSKVCECTDVSITPGGASWLHAIVSINKNGSDDGKKAIDAAFKGHKSLKHVWIVDDDIDIYNPHEVEWAMATRFQGDKNMVIKRESGSSLDPSSELETRMTTKIGFDMTIPSDRDMKHFKKPEPSMKLKIKDYLII